MTYTELINLSIRLGHTKTPEQARLVIDSYDELKGLTVPNVLDYIRSGKKPKDWKPTPEEPELPIPPPKKRRIEW